MEKNHDFASHFLALRKKKGWSQKYVAEKLGISNKAISKRECGRGTPKFSTLLAISTLFKVSIDDLIGYKNNETLLHSYS